MCNKLEKSSVCNSYIPVSGTMLQEALLIAQQLGEDTVNFSASNG